MRTNPTVWVLPSGLLNAGLDKGPSNPYSPSHLFAWGPNDDPSDGAGDPLSIPKVSNSNRRFGTAVLLPLDYDTAPGEERALVLGGFDHNDSTNTAELLENTGGDWAWRSTLHDMLEERTHPSAVLLPDGRVFVAAGHGECDPCDDQSADESTPTVYDTEAFDPAPGQETWTQWAPTNLTHKVRGAVSFLLPDARVLLAGNIPGAPYTYEIFYPPYLFTGLPRPGFLSTPASIAISTVFTVSVDTPAIDQFVLVRPGAVVEDSDFSQRLIRLPHYPIPACTDDSVCQFQVRAPLNHKIAQPGYYLLFALADGVPSIAKWVRVQ